MYILDSARRAGINTKLLFICFEAKLEINKERDWKIIQDKEDDDFQPLIEEIKRHGF